MATEMHPIDRHTRHRFHWVRKNEYECWEYLRPHSWLRPGVPVPKTLRDAAREGWEYVGEAHPPTTQIQITGDEDGSNPSS